MNDEKITISMDEVDRATPVPGSSPPPFFTSAYTPPESEPAEKPKRTGLKIGIAIAAVAVLAAAGIGVAAIATSNGRGKRQIESTGSTPSAPVRTIDDVRREIIADVERDLANPSAPLRKRIENAHMTVDVTSTKVVRCDISTRDGSNRAGRDDSNVSMVELLIRFNWTGFLDSGYTDLKITHDAVNDRTEAVIDYTTAMLNLEDKELWTDVGFILGACLL